MRRLCLTLFILFLMFSSVSFAKVIELNYKATFGIFGTVGHIDNILTQDKKSYKIDTSVKLAGLAKIIMGGQVEHYISKGHMQKGLMVSDMYQMISKKKGKVTSKEYRIYHKKRYVIKRYRKWINGKLVEDSKKRLSFYAKDDLLTLYFNLGKAVNPKGGKELFKAVGLEKQKGRVWISVPKNNQESLSYKKDLGSGAKIYAKALIYQRNFRKKKGDILLSVANDGFINKAVIKDVLFYGDAKLIRVK